MKLHYLLAPALLAWSPSLAADPVYVSEEPLPVASTFDWTGGYIGLNIGGGFGEFEHPFSLVTTAAPPTSVLDGSLDITAGGFLGGAQAGFNWQSGQVIYGLETDFQGSTVKAEDSIDLTVLPGDPNQTTLTGEAGTKVEWFGTLRARLGYAVTERFMIYGTGGLAYGKVKSYIQGDAVGPLLTGTINESKSKTKTGWTIGAGGEYAFTDNWTIKSEYLYTDLGKITLYDDDLAGVGLHGTLKNDVAFHTFRIGFNYKF